MKLPSNLVFSAFISFMNVMNITLDIQYYDIVAEPTNRFTHLIWRAHRGSIEKKYRNKFVPSNFLLEENVVTLPFYMMLPRYVPYTEAFKEQINLMLSNGMIQKWHAKKWEYVADPKKHVEFNQPQTLTLEHLRLGFLGFLICLAISFAVFLIELSIKPVKIFMSTAVARVENYLRRQI